MPGESLWREQADFEEISVLSDGIGSGSEGGRTGSGDCDANLLAKPLPARICDADGVSP